MPAAPGSVFFQPRGFYAAAQLRQIEAAAMAAGISGQQMMRRAAAAAWAAARQAWGMPARVAVFCGVGNNGGDGYEIARLALADGAEVQVYELPGARRGDAAAARRAWCAVGSPPRPCAAAAEAPVPGLVVDALLGIGLNRAADAVVAEAIAGIAALRARGARVLALDVPSGLDADTGHAPGAVVAADLCVSFIAEKPGLRTGRGPALCGQVLLATLDLPAALWRGVEPVIEALTPADLQGWLPPRAADAHKGRHGRLLIIGGAPGMAGAVLLAGRAALRGGAGLVSIATHPAHATALIAAQPELMIHGIADAVALAPLLARAEVVALGPGLGRDAWSQALWQAALEAGRPLVLDADGLNLLAGQPRPLHDAVITPHPGEAARLLGCTVAEVEADRPAAARALQQRYAAVAVLKGAGSLVQGARCGLCVAGNAGMATGGSGDALTGLIAALRGQAAALGLDAETATRAAVVAHAHAADLAAGEGMRGMLPGDLIDRLRRVLNP